MSPASKRLREEAARWFTRMQHAAPDHPERGRFEAWLMSDPAHASEYEAFVKTWDDFDSTHRMQSLADALERKSAALKEKYRKTIARGLVGLFLFVSCGLLGQVAWREWTQPWYVQASVTGIGETGHQLLADGTELILNADTSVDIAYYRNKRLLTLKRGEIILDVSKDPSRPFIVDSGFASVTVLGTNFAVNRLSSKVRVSVKYGRVRVESRGVNAKVLFTPIILTDGEVAEVDAGREPRLSSRSADDAFAFQLGTIVFEQASMGEVAETLSRYREKPIVAVDQNTQHVTAVVQIADIESFLQVLPKIAEVRVSETKGGTQLLRR
ncbi:MAG: hypothetical protein CVU35_01610 [Betaproteobacteria bacterium HGW-Betaproteobacteria-8]|nr:MAG: hypothetical protein CVU35_01610 [Betaproteobacteria bacterium HGW-Betaproteobacteria-8]